MSNHERGRAAHLGDFTLRPRAVLIAALAVPIGAASAGAAYVLLKLIGLITNAVFYQRLDTSLVSPGMSHAPWWWVLLAPVVGGLLIGLMARFGSEKIRGHGMPEAIEAILVGGSRVEPRVAGLKPASAAISIGTGGPFGAEGPIIMTGGAVGSIVAQVLKLSADERKTLLVAGASAGMAATFNAPLASILLAVELLLFEWRPRSLVPTTTAVVVATICRGWMLGTGPIFPSVSAHVGPGITALALIPGITGGLLAIGVTALVYLAEDMFARLPVHWMWWPALGGLIIGAGGLVEPHALGVGYDVIRAELAGHAAMSLIIGILVVKTLIWGLSLGSGTSGGVLAPVFMIGGALGALEGMVLPHAAGGFWAMLGLAAVVGGVMRSPLTGVVFTLELTHAWGNLLPLVIASTAAYALSVLLLKRSVLTEKIARRGLHLTREYSTDPLEVFFADEVMTTAPAVLRANDRVGDILSDADVAGRHLIADTPLWPVLDADGQFLGVVSRHTLFSSPEDCTIDQLVTPARVLAHPDQTLREVANLLAEHQVTQAPVVDREDQTLLRGLISLDQLLHARRHDLEEERHRQRLLLTRLPSPRRGLDVTADRVW